MLPVGYMQLGSYCTSRNAASVAIKMLLVYQPENSNLCGQACVASIAGVTLEDAIKVFGGKRSGTSTRQVVDALRKLGVECGDKLIRISRKREKTNYCIVKLRSTLHKHRHWTIYREGFYFDPGVGVLVEYPDHVVETSFLPIYI